MELDRPRIHSCYMDYFEHLLCTKHCTKGSWILIPGLLPTTGHVEFIINLLPENNTRYLWAGLRLGVETQGELNK